MGNYDLNYSESVKYLGVLLDSKLTLAHKSEIKQRKLLGSYIDLGPQWGSYRDPTCF